MTAGLMLGLMAVLEQMCPKERMLWGALVPSKRKNKRKSKKQAKTSLTKKKQQTQSLSNLAPLEYHKHHEKLKQSLGSKE
jgi:hypothetical protein